MTRDTTSKDFIDLKLLLIIMRCNIKVLIINKNTIKI